MRTDLAHRNRIHDLISSVFLSEPYDPIQCVDLLEDCKEECLQHGLAFSYIISQNIEPIGVSPLDFELLRCDPEKPELLLYLIDQFDGPSQRLDWAIRKACLRREYGGDEIYQQFSPLLHEHDIPALNLQHSFTELDQLKGFAGHISISLYPSALQSVAGASGSFSPLVRNNQLPRSLDKVIVQFLVAKRAWRVVVSNESLKFILLDGPSADVDVQIHVTATAPSEVPEPEPEAEKVESVDDDLDYSDDDVTMAESDANHAADKDVGDIIDEMIAVVSYELLFLTLSSAYIHPRRSPTLQLMSSRQLHRNKDLRCPKLKHLYPSHQHTYSHSPKLEITKL